MQGTMIDRDWFMDRLAARNASVRGLARHVGLDPSAMSRLINGKRQLQTKEVTAIASFLGAEPDEVLRRVGIATPAPKGVTIGAIVDEAGKVQGLQEPVALPPGVIERAAVGVKDVSTLRAAQVRVQGEGPLSMWDDAVVLYQETSDVAQAIGTLAVVETTKGEHLLAHVDRARKTGEATLRSPGGKAREVAIRSASPVLSVVP